MTPATAHAYSALNARGWRAPERQAQPIRMQAQVSFWAVTQVTAQWMMELLLGGGEFASARFLVAHIDLAAVTSAGIITSHLMFSRAIQQRHAKVAAWVNNPAQQATRTFVVQPAARVTTVPVARVWSVLPVGRCGYLSRLCSELAYYLVCLWTGSSRESPTCPKGLRRC